MALGWKIMLPLALANVMVTGAALVDLTLMCWVIGVLAGVGAVILAVRIYRARSRAALPAERRVRA
jgi:hypothetical protein